jgi:hypothetical protein
MSDVQAETIAQELRATLEDLAGASFVGPDARTLHFTFDRQEILEAAYLTVIMDGFRVADEAREVMLRFATFHEFNVLGNGLWLRSTRNLSTNASFPQGPILMWRGGHVPLFGVDADGFWSVQMTYLLLPPFAHLVG